MLCLSHTQLLLKHPNLYTLLVILLIINSKHSCIAKSQVKMLVIISPADADGHHGRTECLQGRCHSIAHMSLGKPAADSVAAEAAPASATAQSVCYHRPLGSTQHLCLAAVRRVPQLPASKDPLPYPIRLHADARVSSGGPRGGHPIAPRLSTGRLQVLFSFYHKLRLARSPARFRTLSQRACIDHKTSSTHAGY